MLTVEDLRGHVETDLEDAALQRLLDAAEIQIARFAGVASAVDEVHSDPGRVLILRRFAGTIAAVREADATEDLEADVDYRLAADGRSIWRLEPGCETCPRRFWGPVKVSYTPGDDEALRDLVAIQLIKGSLNSNPGVLGMTEGNFSIQFANGERWSSTQADALAGLGIPWSFE